MSTGYGTAGFLHLIAVALVALSGARTTLANPTIYRCEVAGVATFSDRPCGARSTVYDPDAAPVSISDPVAPRPSKPQRPKQARKSPGTRTPPAASTAARAGRAEKCARIESSLKDIRAKMRTGYNAKEGERLRERRARLRERRKTEHCE